jgi:hypothetical protein
VVAEPKTKPTTASVDDYVARISKDQLREDCRAVAALMQTITKAPPVMWGPSIVGFGQYRYRYATGREGWWPLTGFAARSGGLVLYVMPGFAGYDDLMKSLGPHSHGVSCLYVKRLSDLHLPTLRTLVTKSVAHTRRMHVPDPEAKGTKAAPQRTSAAKSKASSSKRR